jgi:hypothetical protein
MGAIKSFGGKLLGLFKSHPILTSLFLLFFVVLAGKVVVDLYTKARLALPGGFGTKLPDPKVS